MFWQSEGFLWALTVGIAIAPPHTHIDIAVLTETRAPGLVMSEWDLGSPSSS